MYSRAQGSGAKNSVLRPPNPIGNADFMSGLAALRAQFEPNCFGSSPSVFTLSALHCLWFGNCDRAVEAKAIAFLFHFDSSPNVSIIYNALPRLTLCLPGTAVPPITYAMFCVMDPALCVSLMAVFSHRVHTQRWNWTTHHGTPCSSLLKTATALSFFSPSSSRLPTSSHTKIITLTIHPLQIT